MAMRAGSPGMTRAMTKITIDSPKSTSKDQNTRRIRK
jgi:hypothetical protein